jgi:hypothetical protein
MSKTSQMEKLIEQNTLIIKELKLLREQVNDLCKQQNSDNQIEVPTKLNYDTHLLTIISKDHGEYTVLMNVDIDGFLDEYHEKNPDHIILKRLHAITTADKLWKKIQLELGKNKKIAYDGDNFRLINGYSQKQLLIDIKQINKQ